MTRVPVASPCVSREEEATKPLGNAPATATAFCTASCTFPSATPTSTEAVFITEGPTPGSWTADALTS
jgi:hypothetical protein